MKIVALALSILTGTSSRYAIYALEQNGVHAYTDDSVSGGDLYYVVSATNAEGESSDSGEVARLLAPPNRCTTGSTPDGVGQRMANTIWFVVFNSPENCISGNSGGGGSFCGPADIFGSAYLESVDSGSPEPSLISPNTAANVGVIYGAGAYSSKKGMLHVTASLWRTAEKLSSDPAVDPMGLSTGWTNRNGADIHVLIRSHGRRQGADFKSNVDQIMQFNDPYCTDPNLGHVGASANGNVCKDIQVVPFAADDSSRERKMLSIACGTEVDSRVISSRNKDSFQVFIETNVFF